MTKATGSAVISADGLKAQRADETCIETGLDVLAASKAAAAPDRDVIVGKASDGTYFVIDTPSYGKFDSFKKNAPFHVLLTSPDGAAMELDGTLETLIDNTSVNERVFKDNWVRFQNGSLPGARSVTLSWNGSKYPAVVQGPLGEGSPFLENASLDQAVFTAENGTRYLVALPHFFPDTGFADNGAAVLALDKDTAVTGTLSEFTPGESEWLACEISIGGASGVGTIRRMHGEWDKNLSLIPFQRDAVVKAGDAYYQISVPYDFMGLEPGDAAEITYAAKAMNGGDALPVSFGGEYVEVNNIPADAKYALAEAPSLKVIAADGTPLAPDSPEALAMREALAKAASFPADVDASALDIAVQETERFVTLDNAGRLVLPVGREIDSERLEKLAHLLEKRLSDEAYAVSAAWSWAGIAGKFVHLDITVTAPPAAGQSVFTLADGVGKDWVENSSDPEKTGSLAANVDEILSKNMPFAADSKDKSVRALRRYSRRDDDWDIDSVRFEIAPDGRVVAVLAVAPEAKGFVADVDGAPLFSESWDAEGELPDTVPTHKREKTAAAAFDALSGHYAAEGKILTVERDGKTVPYIPETKRDGDRWRFVATDAEGEALPIVSAPAPLTVSLDAPANDRGRRVGPSEFLLNEIFRDFAAEKTLTAASIDNGLKKLTQWYDERGYLLVGRHLDCEIVNGELKVTARLYRLADKIRVVPSNPDDGLAEKREKHMKYLEREFDFEPGEFVNVNDFALALDQAGKRFPYDIVPHLETDDAEGTMTVTVELVRKPPRGWDALRLDEATLDGGYSLARGVGVSASQASTTHTGYQTKGSVSFYPGVEMGGASATVATPRDAFGNRSEIAAGGLYYLDYVSSAGVSYNYLIPLDDPSWQLLAGLGVEGLFSATGIDGTDALYFKPNFGIVYEDGHGLSARLVGGPRINTQGDFFIGLEASVAKRHDLNQHGLYLEAYAKAGAMIGQVPEAAMFHHVPASLNGVYLQPPVALKLYAVAGVAIMQELPGGFLDVGLGVNGGVIGGLLAVGGGVRIRLKILIPITITLGPAIVNGVPTVFTVGFG